MAINRFLHFLILKILDDSQTFKVSFQLSLYVFVLIHLQGFLSLGGEGIYFGVPFCLFVWGEGCQATSIVLIISTKIDSCRLVPFDLWACKTKALSKYYVHGLNLIVSGSKYISWKTFHIFFACMLILASDFLNFKNSIFSPFLSPAFAQFAVFWLSLPNIFRPNAFRSFHISVILLFCMFPSYLSTEF